MAPYRSQAQRAYMHIHLPKIAKRWDKEYPNQKNLPKHANNKRKLAKSLAEAYAMQKQTR